MGNAKEMNKKASLAHISVFYEENIRRHNATVDKKKNSKILNEPAMEFLW
jgi:hypothetical protein